MAAWFIVIVLVGFIPDAMMKVALVKAGARPPFPLVLHVHAVLMGSFLLLLLAQTWLMATGRKALHMQLGVLGMVLAAALVVVGFILAPTMYYQVWGGATFGPPEVRAALAPVLPILENILLLQIARGNHVRGVHHDRAHREGAGCRAAQEDGDPGDRGAAGCGDRPDELAAVDDAGEPGGDRLYVLLAVAPMFVWDVIRNRRVHEAYWIWFPVFVVVSAAVTCCGTSRGGTRPRRRSCGV